MRNIFKSLERDGGTCQPRVLYLENLTFKNEVGRLVQIHKSRKNFTTADLQEMFMEIHLIEGRQQIMDAGVDQHKEMRCIRNSNSIVK